MDVFTGLLHDAPDPTELDQPSGDRVAQHRALGQLPHGWAVGLLVVTDDLLGRLEGGDGPEVAVSVRSGTGAGGLLALARRRTGVRVGAVETTLRDLDDLPGNAARVVSAASALPEGVEVYVDVPGAPGLVEAVEAIEAGGLLGRVDLRAAPTGPHGYSAAERLSVLVEADLPFKVAGARSEPLGPYGVGPVLMAVEALVDGAEPDEVTALLATGEESRVRAALARWDAATQSRVQRRLRGVDCPALPVTLDRLLAAGLLGPG